ncbi:MAG: hypothetical protein ACKVJU_17140 [Verrucomicrobiales bacterium]
MSEKLSELLGQIGSHSSAAALVGFLGFCCAVLFVYQGWQSDRREWWVRAILVMTAICFLIGSSLNDLREYRYFYRVMEGAGFGEWEQMMLGTRSAKEFLHAFTGASFLSGFF